jgi:hypothetical protein
MVAGCPSTRGGLARIGLEGNASIVAMTSLLQEAMEGGTLRSSGHMDAHTVNIPLTDRG